VEIFIVFLILVILEIETFSKNVTGFFACSIHSSGSIYLNIVLAGLFHVHHKFKEIAIRALPRSSERFGSSLEQVTRVKIRKIKLAAQAYLQSREPEVDGGALLMLWVSVQRGQVTQFNWVKGAFQ